MPIIDLFVKIDFFDYKNCALKDFRVCRVRMKTEPSHQDKRERDRRLRCSIIAIKDCQLESYFFKRCFYSTLFQLIIFQWKALTSLNYDQEMCPKTASWNGTLESRSTRQTHQNSPETLGKTRQLDRLLSVFSTANPDCGVEIIVQSLLVGILLVFFKTNSVWKLFQIK